MQRPPVAEPGRYHDRHRCAFCGADVDRAGPQGLRKVVIKTTHAWGWRCEDSIACLRRRHGEKQLELFDRAG